MKKVFLGTIKKGKFLADSPHEWAQAVRGREGKRTRIEIGAPIRPRTDPQIAYYFAGIVRPFAEHTGNSEDAIHGYLKDKVMRPLLGRRLWLPLPSGNHIEDQPSTTLLSQDEMNEYIANCRKFLWEHEDFLCPDIDHVPVR